MGNRQGSSIVSDSDSRKESTPLIGSEIHENEHQDYDDEPVAMSDSPTPAGKSFFQRWLLPRILYYIPLFQTFIHYKWNNLTGDIIAGITVGIMLIPQGLSYATLTGVSPVQGLYTACFPGFVYVIFATSRQLSFGPEAVVALLVGTSVQQILATDSKETDTSDLIALLTLMVGIFTFVLGLCRFGFLDNILSRPILRGYITAVAVLIAVEQVDALFGFKLTQHGWAKVWYILNNVSDIHPLTLGMGLSSIAILYTFNFLKNSHFLQKSKYTAWIRLVPEILLVVVTSTILTFALQLDQKGLAVLGKQTGGIPVPKMPTITVSRIEVLLAPCVAISIIGFVESIIVGKYYATKNNYSISANRELVAFGAANIFGTFLGAWPCFASIPRSGVNAKSGAKTVVASMISGVVVLITMLSLLRFLTYLPTVVMSSVIIQAAISLIEFEEIKFLIQLKAYKDLLLILFTAAATIVFSTEIGLVISIVVSLFFIVKHSSFPTVTVRGRIEGTDKFQDHQAFKDINLFKEKHAMFKLAASMNDKGILILKIDEPLYFVNIGTIKSLLKKLEQCSTSELHGVIMDVANVNHFDATAMQTLVEIGKDFKSRGILLCFVKLKSSHKELFIRSGLLEIIGAGNLFAKTHDAVAFVDGLSRSYSSYHIL